MGSMGEVRYRTEASASKVRQDPLSGDRGLGDSSKTGCRLSSGWLGLGDK